MPAYWRSSFFACLRTELGPIRTSKKVVYLDKFSVIANASQVRTVCRDLPNFVPRGKIFKRTADKICPG